MRYYTTVFRGAAVLPSELPVLKRKGAKGETGTLLGR